MLTISLITSRHNPRFDWWFDSLRLQPRREVISQIIVVDYFAQACDDWSEGDVERRRSEVFKAAGDFCEITQWLPPRPTVWGGKYRVTKRSWWHKSAALNTALCFAKDHFFATTDDRSVASPSWLQAVRDAIEKNFCVVGTYEKRVNVRVENGEIVEPGTVIGLDHRREHAGKTAKPCIGTWLFGCSFALPLEWALQVNGLDESMDSLGQEDTQFGSMLAANGFDIRLDARMHVTQDRTPGECGPEMKRTSKERFQYDTQDRGHEAIRRFFGQKQASHVWNIREIRNTIQAGGEWPTLENVPKVDWWDGAPITEFQ